MPGASEEVFRRACRVTANASPEIGPAPIGGLREVSIDIKIGSARPEPPELPVPSKPSPARLLLARPGQSTRNREHRLQLPLDPPLPAQARTPSPRPARPP